MSTTTFAVNHPLSNKLWAKKLTVEGLKATYFGKFMGTGSSAMIHVKTEPSKGAGDELTFGLRMQLNGDGVTEGQTLEGNELDVQRAEIEAQTQYRLATVGRWYEPEKLMGYAVAVYIAKLLVYDKVLGLGSTDPLGGWIETTANLIVAFYFGKRGAENVARIVAGALKK